MFMNDFTYLREISFPVTADITVYQNKKKQIGKRELRDSLFNVIEDSKDLLPLHADT